MSSIMGYTPDNIKEVPEGANLGLGCGNPVALASLRPGETVVDLGSGGGFDCFLAAKAVGNTGKVIGVDMTPDMVSKARKNAGKIEAKNVESRFGEIENLPIAFSLLISRLTNLPCRFRSISHRMTLVRFRFTGTGVGNYGGFKS